MPYHAMLKNPSKIVDPETEADEFQNIISYIFDTSVVKCLRKFATRQTDRQTDTYIRKRQLRRVLHNVLRGGNKITNDAVFEELPRLKAYFGEYITENNLCSKSMNNASVAEDHRRQREQVADKEREKSNALLHSIAVVGSKPYARSLDYTR